MIEYRDVHPEQENQFFDLQYQDFVKDPIAAAKNIYNYFGLEYTDEFEENMKTYLANNPQGKHGRAKYTLEEYGLTEQMVREQCPSYTKRFYNDVVE
tara:strand:+ start:382 stop:672 length:291 start_codon:yes stop_codon:yes gene_type:complete